MLLVPIVTEFNILLLLLVCNAMVESNRIRLICSVIELKLPCNGGIYILQGINCHARAGKIIIMLGYITLKRDV